MAKRAIRWAYGCDICGCSGIAGNDLAAAEAGWVVSYPEEPWDETDCVVLCPKHKHKTNIPKDHVHIFGKPYTIISEGTRLLESKNG